MSSHLWIEDFPECAGKAVLRMKGNRARASPAVSECFSRSFPGDGATTHPNFHRRQSCYIGLKSASPCISMISPRTVTGAQGCFVACVIFTKAKTARGTIARRGVLEKEKNEPRDMPSPALAFMQWPAEDRQNRINRSNTWRVGPADCRSQRNRQADVRVRASRKTAYGSKEYAVEIATVVHHFLRSNAERMNLVGIR